MRPRPARSSAPQQTTSKPARAKPRAAASPARPAPATKTSQPRAARMSRSIIFDLSPRFPNAAPASIGSRETAARNFDKAEAARSSWSRRAPRCRRMKAGRAGHVDREAARSRRAGGGILRTRFYRLRRRGGGAGALRGDRAQFLCLLRLARIGAVHRWNRRHAGARRARAGDRGFDRRGGSRPGGRFPHLRARAGRGALALGPDADRGLVLDRACRYDRLGALFRRHPHEDRRSVVSRISGDLEHHCALSLHSSPAVDCERRSFCLARPP